MNVKYQIFVSSTYQDLKDERNEVIKACLNMGHIPVGMEMFNAADEEQWAVITRTIDQCDYYVVIVAHRYGSTVDGISFTEKEYDYAIAQGLPVLGFVIEDAAPWPNDRIDKDQASVKALRRFKLKVKQKMVRSWKDKSELQAHFAISLTTTINLSPRRGWVRAPEAGGVDIAQALSNLIEENARLRQILDETKSASAQRDEVDEAVSLLSSETFDTNDSSISGEAVFLRISSALDAFLEYKAIVSYLEREFSIEEKVAGNFLQELRLSGLVQTRVGAHELTQLGRRVYKRLSLAIQPGPTRPDSPP